ncbi:jg26964 [Pararge aegeria aegeria]|uniref:Jg26964 protein n=1 Tax=Pararge aegeria aegeria TaxID=348720 RepID=A0A8S4RVF2_9NEOP|nr:jg26964 [Pararge aegeria aegeria]
MKADSFSWTSYHNLEGIYQWMTDIAAENSEKLNLTAIGLSAEGREILAIEFHNPKAKGTVIIEGGLHGNEWITTEFVTYLIYHIAKADKARNVKLQQVATKYRWILIPVVNPDGYVYSMSNDRMWRKNRNKLGNGLVGVDLNRNFDYNFCSHDSSNKSTDDNYCGSRPFSEPETQAISNYVRRNSYNLKFYFSIHAYGQKIIVPYSDRVKHLENFSEMENYGKQAILQIYKLYRVKYGIGTIYDIYGYRSSGDSVSWVKKSYNVKYALTFLLRDNGTYGYALPPAMILPSCKEMLVGLLEVMTVRHRHVDRELFSSTVNTRSTCMMVLLTLPKIIVEGGIHAREWISVAFATYFLHEIVTSPESNDTALKAAAERFEWSFVPVLNPDGYEYSHVKYTMGLLAAKRIEQRYNTMYTVGTAYDTVGYKVSGVSGCWVKKSFSVPYVMTFELRDTGRHGFALPPKEILPTCQETMDGIVSLLSSTEKIARDIKAEARMDKLLDKIVIVWNILLFIIVQY